MEILQSHSGPINKANNLPFLQADTVKKTQRIQDKRNRKNSSRNIQTEKIKPQNLLQAIKVEKRNSEILKQCLLLPSASLLLVWHENMGICLFSNIKEKCCLNLFLCLNSTALAILNMEALSFPRHYFLA